MLAWTAAAFAQPPTCPSHPSDVEAAAARSAAAIAEDDPAGHTAAFEELLAALPCLDGPVPRTAWVRLLLGEAIVRFAAGGEWKDPLAAALAADPTLPVPDFLSTAGLPDDRTPVPGTLQVPVTVDGADLEAPVALWGLHVVQARTPELHTWVVRDGELPEGLVAPPAAATAPPAPAPRRWVAVGLGGAWIDQQQRVDRPGTLLPDTLTRTAGAAGSASARLGLAGPLAAVGDATVSVGRDVGLFTELGPALRGGPVAVWVGGALVSLGVDEPDGHRVVPLPQPAGGVVVVLPGERPIDLWVSGGASPGSVWHVRARWGAGLAPVGEHLVLRLSTDLTGVGGRFVQQAAGARAAEVTRWTAGLQLGVAAGR